MKYTHYFEFFANHSILFGCKLKLVSLEIYRNGTKSSQFISVHQTSLLVKNDWDNAGYLLAPSSPGCPQVEIFFWRTIGHRTTANKNSILIQQLAAQISFRYDLNWKDHCSCMIHCNSNHCNIIICAAITISVF